MAKSLRLSEKWFRRGLWLVALVFASFLIGLGGSIVGDLPKVERTLSLEGFMDPQALQPLRAQEAQIQRQLKGIDKDDERLQLQLRKAEQDSANARATFENWISTRQATQRGQQDTELVARTQALDRLKAREQEVQDQLDIQHQAALAARQAQERVQQDVQLLEQGARVELRAAQRSAELRVFGYRLALTLPLLLLAVWLFVKQRKSAYWPFVWGFIFFALFAFFVELVPYMPSYGGYVRYVVGIAVTVVVGRYAVVALNRYLAQQQLAEAQPDQVRREEMSYDTALARLAKGVCPGCERPMDGKTPGMDFCPHCGICLFERCLSCAAHKSAFAKFCHACGVGAAALRGAGGSAPASLKGTG